jgi:hypothetical protein
MYRGGVKIKKTLKCKGIKFDIICRANWTVSEDRGEDKIK